MISEIWRIWAAKLKFRYIPKNPRSMSRVCRQAIAQFVLKIEKLSHTIGTAPILDIARAYGLRPRLWLPVNFDIVHIRNLGWDSSCLGKTMIATLVFCSFTRSPFVFPTVHHSFWQFGTVLTAVSGFVILLCRLQFLANRGCSIKQILFGLSEWWVVVLRSRVLFHTDRRPLQTAKRNYFLRNLVSWLARVKLETESKTQGRLYFNFTTQTNAIH